MSSGRRHHAGVGRREREVPTRHRCGSLRVWESGDVSGGFQTERLALRPVERGDLGLLVELNNDAGVMEFITGRASTADETAVELAASLGARWLAFARADGEFLGWVSAVPDRRGEHYEIGWRFKRSAWGRGYATEAGSALVDLAFSRGARRLSAQTMAVNTRSRAVMERLGLRHHATFHLAFDDPLPGTEHGEVEYEILRSEWIERRRPA